jgi:hypothetical protein
LDASLLLLFAFPILPLRLSAALVFPFLLFAALSLWDSPRVIRSPAAIWLLAAFVAFPLFYLTELPFAGNAAYVWGILQRKLGIIFIPLGFYMVLRANVRLDYYRYMRVLVGSIGLLVLYATLTMLIKGPDPDQLASGGRAYAFRTGVEQLTHLHPTYFGLLIAFASLFILHRLTDKGVRRGLVLPVLLLLVLFMAFLFLLAARMAIGSLVVATLVLIFRKPGRVRAKLLLSSGLLLVVVAAVVVVPTLNSRVTEVFASNMNSTRVRLFINSCGWGVAKAYWLTGVSVERLQPSLDLCYDHLGASEMMVRSNYNTHNEYLNVLCGKGIGGLFLFLLLLFLLLRKGSHQPLLLSFCILFALACLTEDLLERQIGVFFFSLLGGLLGIYTHPDLPPGISKRHTGRAITMDL